MENQRYAIVLHAGAAESWIGNAESRIATEDFLHDLIARCKEALLSGKTAVKVVADAVAALEDHPSFNSGKGAAINDEGFHELEAGIVDGTTSQYRAVGCLKQVKNPVRLAQAMLDSSSSHVFLVGQAGDDLARTSGLEMVENDYFTTPERRNFWLSKKRQKVDEHGTVGAVALDLNGGLAAANSTGGLMFKQVGRMGDTAIIGAGIYADKDVSIACSGGGEAILQAALASKIAQERQGREDLSEAIVSATTKATALFPQLSCGVIAVDREGNVFTHCNSRIFTTAFCGASSPTWAGISWCTIPIIEPLRLFEDHLVRAGFAKHPSLPRQVIFKLKRPIDIMNLDRNLVTSLFQRVQVVSQLLMKYFDVPHCGISMRDGRELMLFPLRRDGEHLSLSNAAPDFSNSQVIGIDNGFSVILHHTPSNIKSINLFSPPSVSTQFFSQHQKISPTMFEALCNLLETVPLTATCDISSWTLTINPFSKADSLAEVEILTPGEEQHTYFPAPAPFNVQYQGYLCPELGPRLTCLEETIRDAKAMSTPCAKAVSCLNALEVKP